MIETLSILGSTGSIGTQALQVAKNLGIKVVALSANRNIDLLYQQIVDFKPELVAVGEEILARHLGEMLSNNGLQTEVSFGLEGFIRVAQISSAQMLLTSVVGSFGLLPTLAAIRTGKTIALANKETLVSAGKIVIDLAKEYQVSIIPVDSEHSAIFQCLNGESEKSVQSIILTASGGPFRGMNGEQLTHVSREQALKHPNWSMGSKITIDSATMMNKGLEVIEARWLFDIAPEKISVVVHPQSIIHSMVEFVDNSTIAQLGLPDMRTPIQYAFTYPQRVENDFGRLNLPLIKQLTFEAPDLETFRCLKFAFQALADGGTAPCALNAANEAAVALFLQDKIKFSDIPFVIEEELLNHQKISEPSIEEILECDRIVKRNVIQKYTSNQEDYYGFFT